MNMPTPQAENEFRSWTGSIAFEHGSCKKVEVHELLYSYMGQKQNVSGSALGSAPNHASKKPSYDSYDFCSARPRQKRDLNHAPLLMKLHFNSPGPFATYSPLTIPSVA